MDEKCHYILQAKLFFLNYKKNYKSFSLKKKKKFFQTRITNLCTIRTYPREEHTSKSSDLHHQTNLEGFAREVGLNFLDKYDSFLLKVATTYKLDNI